MSTSAILFGAGGNVGKAVLPALLEAGVNVTVATRQDSKSTFPGSVKVVTTNYESVEDLTSIIRGNDAVISLVNTAALSKELLLVDAAAAAGASLFIPSQFGHDTSDDRIAPLLPIFGKKQQTVARLKEKEKDGLTWTAIITALFFDWGLNFGTFDVDLKKGKATIWDGGETRFSASNMEDIALAVVRLVTDPVTREKYKNQHVYVSSVQMTQKELVAAAEAVTGKTFDITEYDSDVAFREGSPIKVLQAIQFSGKGLADFQAKVDAGKGRFIVDKREDVRTVLKGLAV
ncbi:uncharacterized protein PV09_07508 [Verruconis gallopava]|uniref:NmrA-like domain-containing protein n=1 Tax=Verruconis gallopava TaxID=253628 RepID=A0A0D2A2M5_9PEZI|nr:uncharacterized protein PV09_07508 [Verruconis gallopava]KIW00988.1 hypothetical protein PV09_07508 [Verruconis gallopava]